MTADPSAASLPVLATIEVRPAVPVRVIDIRVLLEGDVVVRVHPEDYCPAEDGSEWLDAYGWGWLAASRDEATAEHPNLPI